MGGITGADGLDKESSVNDYMYTVKHVLVDHCHERPPVLTDHTFLAEGPTFQYN